MSISNTQRLNLCPSPDAWIDCVIAQFDEFLLDHASAEKKASGMAMNLIAHYPDKPELVESMTDLAIEELNHFREVVRIIQAKGLQLKGDEKDPYVNKMIAQIGKGKEPYLIDRLIIAGIIEARGYERFSLVALHLPETQTKLKAFYQGISRSEERHAWQFLELAERYTQTIDVPARCRELIAIEQDIFTSLPIKPQLH